MTEHKLGINDGAATEDSAGVPPSEDSAGRRSYVVTDKAARPDVELEDGTVSIGSEGIFKNGTLYKPGEQIELDEQSAANYKALGEVADV